MCLISKTSWRAVLSASVSNVKKISEGRERRKTANLIPETFVRDYFEFFFLVDRFLSELLECLSFIIHLKKNTFFKQILTSINISLCCQSIIAVLYKQIYFACKVFRRKCYVSNCFYIYAC